MKSLNELFGRTAQKSETKQTHSCCGGNEHQHHEESSVNPQTVYQCPMKCEGDKTYNAPGNCPVCNMHLKAVN